jgi:cytosine/adenosine deaminase-related metal-dependent hydrolase
LRSEPIILSNASLADGATSTFTIADGKLKRGAWHIRSAIEIETSECLLFPGLINSHDHLHFNLFPQLGNRMYMNYVEWGKDIHVANKEEIARVVRVDKKLRTLWGMYKNMLAGVTTVVHHGEELSFPSNMINVFTQCYSLHSVQLERRWKYRLNRPFRHAWPFVIHVGEGMDAGSNNEIDSLVKWNFVRRKLIGVHAVAMEEAQANAFDALVWCPQSNYFLLGSTAQIDKLKQHTKILFGTDSTVSSEWDIWSHLRSARKTGLLTDAELMNTVGVGAAAIWGLSYTGALGDGMQADVVLAKKKCADVADAFFAVSPSDIQLVLCKGRPVLYDESLHEQFAKINVKDYSRVCVDGVAKYVIGDLPGLIKKIQKAGCKINLPVTTD